MHRGPALVVGASGQVGRHVSARLASTRPVIALSRADLDLRDEEQIRAIVRSHSPSVVINAAAYTQVDDAEREQATCWAINAVAPGILASEAAAIGALTIDFSTNYVFDGKGEAAYREDNAVSPLSVYGRSKAEGERSIAAANPRHIVIRTHGVYDRHGRNFVGRILELARERTALKVVNDQVGAPTPAALIAGAVATILETGDRRGWSDADYGLLHVTTAGRASWYDVACLALALDPQRALQRSRIVHPIGSREFPTPAVRPLNGLLDTRRARTQFGVVLPRWDVALEAAMRDWEIA